MNALQLIKTISTFHSYQLEYQVNEFLAHCVEEKIVASYKNYFYGLDFNNESLGNKLVSRFNAVICVEIPESRISEVGTILQSEDGDMGAMYENFTIVKDEKK